MVRPESSSSWPPLARWVAVAAVVLLLALAVAACGDDQPKASKPVALAIVDDTSSFDEFAPACARDFVSVAKAVAVREGHLYAGALLTGDPYRQTFAVEADFGEPVPAAIDGNSELEDAYRRRKAEGLASAFERMTRTEPAVGGSPVLSTLERASRFRRDRAPGSAFWLVVCSDLASIGDGLDVRRPIDGAVVSRTVKEWTGRLSGLSGADLYFIGAGRLRPGSAAQPEAIRQVERILHDLADRVGAEVRLVDTQLGQTFPLGHD